MHVVNKRMRVKAVSRTLLQPIIRSRGIKFQITEQDGLEVTLSTKNLDRVTGHLEVCVVSLSSFRKIP
jgi:hypothetical protein